MRNKVKQEVEAATAVHHTKRAMELGIGHVGGFMSFNQCLIWLSFSPVATATREYYNLCHTEAECEKQGGMGQSQIDLMLNWGPIIYLPTAIPLGVYAMRRSNLRKIVVTGAVVRRDASDGAKVAVTGTGFGCSPEYRDLVSRRATPYATRPCSSRASTRRCGSRTWG